MRETGKINFHSLLPGSTEARRRTKHKKHTARVRANHYPEQGSKSSKAKATLSPELASTTVSGWETRPLFTNSEVSYHC